MLRWRLLFGAIFIAGFVAICVGDYRSGVPGSWLFPLALVATIALAKEMIDLLTTDTQRPMRWAIYLGSVFVVLSNAPHIYARKYINVYRSEMLGYLLPTAQTLAAFAACMIMVIAIAIFRFRERQGTVTNVAITIFSIAYIGIFMSAAIQIRMFSEAGMLLLISLVAVVKCGDIGAYTIGRLIGKHKLSPKLSPGKTIEGAVGALVFAVLASLASLLWLGSYMYEGRSNVGWVTAVIYGLLIGACGILGDLAESLIKRDGGKKDSSNLLPGFGGVFDVLDSILFAAPVALIYWLSFIIWHGIKSSW